MLQLSALGFRINLTPSMPLGIYRLAHKTDLKRGDWVGVCLSDEVQKEGRANQYLSWGTCSAWAEPVFKAVIGLPGDEVFLTQNEVIINGKSYLSPRQKGVRTFIKTGHFNLGEHEIWLYGMKDPKHSWDSRYFGPVEKKGVLGADSPAE